ncbi:MAG: MBL fold metallo-hydrolase [Anaerolineae bacterium]
MPTGQALLDQMNNLPILPNSLAIWGLGQMGFAIKGPDALICIDPCLSDVVKGAAGDWWERAYHPPLMPENLTNITYYLASHEHMDHFDPLTAGPAAKAAPTAHFIAPGWCMELMEECGIAAERRIFPKALEPVTLPETTLKLTAIPSAHYVKEYDAQKGYRWLGYLIEWNGIVIYHAGDTIIHDGYVDTLKKLPVADVAILPVNGRDWHREAEQGAIGNLLPDEAAWLARHVGWGMVIAGHNDMYPNNTIPMGQIADAFVRYAPRQPYKIMQPGELYYMVK